MTSKAQQAGSAIVDNLDGTITIHLGSYDRKAANKANKALEAMGLQNRVVYVKSSSNGTRGGGDCFAARDAEFSGQKHEIDAITCTITVPKNPAA